MSLGRRRRSYTLGEIVNLVTTDSNTLQVYFFKEKTITLPIYSTSYNPTTKNIFSLKKSGGAPPAQHGLVHAAADHFGPLLPLPSTNLKHTDSRIQKRPFFQFSISGAWRCPAERRGHPPPPHSLQHTHREIRCKVRAAENLFDFCQRQIEYKQTIKRRCNIPVKGDGTVTNSSKFLS